MKRTPYEYDLNLLESRQYILGLDEVGRGCWAGPVSVGAVILDLAKANSFYKDVKDSKAIKDKKRRQLAPLIQEAALFSQVAHADPKTIDEQGISGAIRQLMYDLVQKALQLFPASKVVIVSDAVLPGLWSPQECEMLNYKYYNLAKGDVLSLTVAAASILAKVTRDKVMENYHEQYPHYQFNNHKGYGTDVHFQAIQDYGKCALHRQTFNIRKLR